MENTSPVSVHAPPQQEDPTKQAKPPAAPYSSVLHSVQKASPKPWKKLEQSRATRVYNVNPRDFRDLVQQLTGAGSPSSEAAKRPLNSSPHMSTAFMHGGSSNGHSAVNSAMHEKDRRAMRSLESPTGFMDIFPASSSLPRSWQIQSP